jgi:hypothetical protein
MKKLILLFVLLGTALLSRAQSPDYRSFKFDIGLGYALPSDGSGTQAGAAFTLQPTYRLTDDFAIGLRVEAAAIGYKNSETDNVKVSALASACPTAEYYLSDNYFRPFVGVGLGLFDQESVGGNTSNGNGVTVSARTTGFGAFPEIGFEVGHFRMSAEYNFAGHSNNYAALNIGAFFGGGRKKK